jgi:hypothetical protein
MRPGETVVSMGVKGGVVMKRSLAVGIGVLLVTALTASAPAATPSTAKPAMGPLAYLGMAKDVVGRLAVASPNGERDAQFTATLSTSAKIPLKGIVLQRVFAKGGYAEGWDTYRGTSGSILAVVLDGKRLNTADRDLSVTLAPGTHRLVVYANDHYGVFAPGQLFRLTANFPDYLTASATTKLKGGKPSITARFTGLGTDVVGRGADQKANGEPDAHFEVTLSTNGSWQIIRNVVLRRYTAGGAADVPIYWMQGPNTAGLLVNGTRYLWPTEMPWWISVYVPVNPKASPVKLDVYANDPTDISGGPSGLFAPGQVWRVSVEFTDQELVGETSTMLKL